jgi:DNA-binding NtrC family response regulator
MHFLEHLNEEGGAVKRVDLDVLSAIEGRRWPGNVRELRNALQRAWILADGLIRREHMDAIAPSQDAPGPSDDARAAPTSDGTVDTSSVLRIAVGTPLAEVERRLVLATLAACEGNKRKTARVLGVSVKTLYNRLAEYERGPSPAPSGD